MHSVFYISPFWMLLVIDTQYTSTASDQPIRNNNSCLETLRQSAQWTHLGAATSSGYLILPAPVME